VFRLYGKDSLPRVPEGAVLVAPQALAHYAVVLDRVRAVVTDSGSPAGHLALVAREFQVPVLVNTRRATRVLPQGEIVTVFADHAVVVRGNHIPEDLRGRDVRGLPFKDNPFFNRLRLMLRFISPLNLTDPDTENFRPEGCRTLHDIVRFCHEQAVREMFTSAEGISGARGAKRLVSELPITMFVVDLGGGLVPEAEGLRAITPDQIASSPLKAVWRGLAEPEICWADLTRFDWKGFDQVLMAGGMASKGSAGLATYAVISAEYLNLNMRFGYHFLVLDSICSQDAQRNYIVFRFAGGGGAMTGRLLRMEFLRLVLERLGFETSSKADMLDAQLMSAPPDITEAALEQLGRLAAVTQLMDMYLKDSSMAVRFAEDFLRGDYSFARRMEPEMCRTGTKREKGRQKG
jgi:pyruvate,water dikinase